MVKHCACGHFWYLFLVSWMGGTYKLVFYVWEKECLWAWGLVGIPFEHQPVSMT